MDDDGGAEREARERAERPLGRVEAAGAGR